LSVVIVIFEVLLSRCPSRTA